MAEAAARTVGRRTLLVGLAMLAGYVTWMLGPYLRSIVVRDAAVTMWINVATSPIYGTVDRKLPALGSRVPESGRIVLVHNERADRTDLDAELAEVARWDTVIADLTTQVATLERLDEEWRARRGDYAATMEQMLKLEAEGARRELAYIAQRRSLVAGVAERKAVLARKGNAAQTEADEANAELADLELKRVEQEKRVALAELRLAAAARGSYVLADGSDPDWAFRTGEALAVDLARARGELAAARAAHQEAEYSIKAEMDLFAELSDGAVTAPAGSVIWSMIVGAGATVDVGSPVAQWLDCSQLLVDVPLSDVEVALLRQGAVAEVVLEGEPGSRRGEVVLTRGSASTLGPVDLAAVAKGRRPGVAQAILSLEKQPQDAESCPIGRAAFVDFPEIGLIDILRARLRL